VQQALAMQAVVVERLAQVLPAALYWTTTQPKNWVMYRSSSS
jgi:hypothetical protein